MSVAPMRQFFEFDLAIRQTLERFDVRSNKPEDPSTFTMPKPNPRAEGAGEAFWLQGRETKQHWDSGRTAGYLAAYVQFAGPTFPATGIPVENGYVWLDRGVVCSLLEGACIEFTDGFFRLTEKGRALIAPVVRLTDAEFEAAF